ncbi:ciliogenesis-associated TTC17-interacting protein [Betta splendens]|uniref:Ciliogenesis-associated TTC17-interacting protein n=1 Tax=Betta splendens TaxID=158456 RepID=A0A6P7L1G9_BETSP|nr:ciliogenesis-associated TTC17-interacting protein [Betta splendens]
MDPVDDSPVGASVGIERLETGEQLITSDEALTFMSSIEPTELQNCVFPDSLVTVSEGGRALGLFSVTVEFARRLQQPCVLLRAQSQGTIDESPCGTTVTVYITSDLEVLEEDYHEYLELEGHSVNKRYHMVQQDGHMVMDKVTTMGEEVTKESVSYPMSVLRGLVTEGSNLLLMRLLALRKEVPENMTFTFIDQNFHIVHTSFIGLGLKRLEVGGGAMEVFGVERLIQSHEDTPTTWQCYFLEDGHLVHRAQVGSPVTMRLLELPRQPEQAFERIPLVLEEDMEMRSKFLKRKEELKADHALYLRKHPQIRALISDFLQFLLLRKPEDIFQFAREYFLTFASHQPSQASVTSRTL